ncbi:IS3 family transposase [Pseudomonas chlororaphis subsp. aurantiaca]|nr:IS3 family transposase [Pseudomonas chlororaphis]QLL10653.1 IS3 family transposase [Pseudomonas chlororaphis subsp. aurantiaca]QLL11108.1 IS3 family transposase [Pseudomonas chlororaphis subsp. aurantiaca]QLL11143.1 IS3 family transposase [Pseudomonas chlororaphis subsp. aurantiaca]QLL11653.1 IS3 family transposase [Pseudomonas chlororaphis subsp. aurantiaca]QLL12556.1 IS3 family transposase [Pseudomonas chlororaphis subsp. aurantiaca]
MFMTNSNDKSGELLGQERRRRWSPEQKLAMVRESLEPGQSVSVVARRNGINANQLFLWRKLYQDGSLSAVSAGEAVVPASELSDALKQIRELQRMLGKKTMEAEILKEAVEIARSRKLDCALTLVAGGRPVKLVSECLGVARSQLTVRIKQSVSPKVRRSRPVDDAALVVEIQQQVSELPSYGYRRVWGLLRRARETQSLPAINVKRVYRVMRDHNLLLERRLKQPGVPRRHEGRIAVKTSDTRWCSDGFEFRCEDGAKLSVTFALDCCDREAIGWVASPTGYSGDDIRDLMLESVEKRFGDQLPVTPVQWLSDNGSAYTAEQTRLFARQIGLQPVTTPVRSPQSNGMAESFVKTIKRDYVAHMPKPDRETALRNLAIAFEHYNEQHPHSALNYRSPREFRRLAPASI